MYKYVCLFSKFYTFFLKNKTLKNSKKPAKHGLLILWE